MNCGHISISGNRFNYFVNDKISLINIIIPIFNYRKLNSSKLFKFLIFKQAVKLIENKKHLTSKGKFIIINLYNDIKIPLIYYNNTNNNNIIINDN